MSGSMYDLSVATYSQEGRIYQVEYATKAVENSETVIGVKCKDGVILGAEKQKFSRLLEDNTNKRIYNIDLQTGMALCGKLPDGRNILQRAKAEASQYQDMYAIPASAHVLSDRVAQYVHAYTMYSGVRPFGSATFIASYNTFDGYELYMIEPSGNKYAYHACTHGKGRAVCKSEFERRNFKDLTCQEALVYIAKMLILAHEEFKEKKYEYEMTWITDNNGRKHQSVPQDLINNAVQQAEQLIEQDQIGE
ncbi:unnamed protein product [Paramecium primaurelia]|uniref:Proteasome alpha-type subunits domain-containing protein n=1 Tax=Paramecium primaurelia TaxID=5886 RepID=A0A8S1P461_PARPR|nr:unnamed protein product [Paramecium primaurelia]